MATRTWKRQHSAPARKADPLEGGYRRRLSSKVANQATLVARSSNQTHLEEIKYQGAYVQGRGCRSLQRGHRQLFRLHTLARPPANNQGEYYIHEGQPRP